MRAQIKINKKEFFVAKMGRRSEECLVDVLVGFICYVQWYKLIINPQKKRFFCSCACVSVSISFASFLRDARIKNIKKASRISSEKIKTFRRSFCISFRSRDWRLGREYVFVCASSVVMEFEFVEWRLCAHVRLDKSEKHFSMLKTEGEALEKISRISTEKGVDVVETWTRRKFENTTKTFL